MKKNSRRQFLRTLGVGVAAVGGGGAIASNARAKTATFTYRLDDGSTLEIPLSDAQLENDPRLAELVQRIARSQTTVARGNSYEAGDGHDKSFDKASDYDKSYSRSADN